ncbi:diaminopimelate epimerase [Parasediminibacterium sp. JCM 36343]|uniref:diaminopimelate epimerase n=1 Tax=Parasediminibacterium sp. JCM 36343 TaxID=3374279 RepID=UPI00397AD16A
MELIFYKYQGTGNDFIIMDNRGGDITLATKQVKDLCDRKFGIGADGLMLLQTIDGYDFEMKYYNADGRESSMCGNGGRCLTQFAFDNGIQKEKYVFLAVDGPHEAFFSDGWVHLKMKDVEKVENVEGDYVLNTGSPHFVKQVMNVMSMDVYAKGHEIRYSDDFKAEGINVNFVEIKDEDEIIVRTYERGVENETLSCGTGVTASALIFAHNDLGFNRVEVSTPGGKLAVEFDKKGEGIFENIWLCGPATFVFKGLVNVN